VGIKEYAGRIGKVVNHEIKKAVQIISETRKDYNQKAVQYNPSGEDSPPVIEDQLVMLKIDGTGKYVVVGVFNETQGAKPGEKILFARDQKGKIVLKIRMLNNGDYYFDNDSETTGDATGNYNMKIKGNFNKEIKKNSKTIIHENKSEEIKGNDKLDVKGNSEQTIGGNSDENISGNKTIKAAMIKLN
jgi:uncharacterized protein YjbJ (UPF0337 family)